MHISECKFHEQLSQRNSKMTLTKPFRKIIKPANLAISAFFKPFVTSQFP